MATLTLTTTLRGEIDQPTTGAVTLSTPDQQDDRLITAFTAELRLKQPATADDIKGAIAKYLQDVVLRQEKIAALRAAAAQTFDVA